MQTNEVQTSRVRRTVNDLVLAEMFLVQATIESATAIGDGLSELGKQISRNEDSQAAPGIRSAACCNAPPIRHWSPIPLASNTCAS